MNFKSLVVGILLLSIAAVQAGDDHCKKPCPKREHKCVRHEKRVCPKCEHKPCACEQKCCKPRCEKKEHKQHTCVRTCKPRCEKKEHKQHTCVREKCHCRHHEAKAVVE